ncbi:class II aldolase/adducin family protein [Amycolatopsis acidiphila]|uniref:Class II aldolase/adducin family protein n=2 Tax=Amycolatopsis acidiphila TaxID=715473 RepID=A0A557ZP01_9PSEU|nr:class II aldolase/adducin family protein [Amycolatopsis acidiphila]
MSRSSQDALAHYPLASESAEGIPRTAVEEAVARSMVATACRILAHQGLAADILGHVSTRADNDSIWVRCRGPQERGLLFTRPDDIRRVPLVGRTDLPDGYAVPNELPIHSEIMRARPDVQAVVHVHPPAVVAADIAGLTLRPIVGAFNIPAMRLASDGIPVYPRSVLIRRTELGRAVADALGMKHVCVLRGHGIVTTGETVQQAVVRALNLEALARLTLDASAHGDPEVLSAEDAAELPDLGSTFNDQFVWHSLLAKLDHDGL